MRCTDFALPRRFVGGAIARLVHDEPRFLQRWVIVEHAKGWLLRLTNFNQRHGMWRALARTILAPPTDELRALARRLGATP